MTNVSRKLCILLLAGFAAVAAQAATLQLTCPDSGDAGKEARRIKEIAAGVVKRHATHELHVQAGGKTLKFIDQPPYDEPLDGTRYAFCDRQDGFILLTHVDGSLFTGKLINEATGNVTQGGERVTFSPDRRAYFASEQPDGLDGSVWSIHAVNGRESWSGFSFIPHPTKRGYMAASLTDERWEPGGQFSAQAECFYGNGIKWRVKLVNDGGQWGWRPARKCPDA